MAPRGARLRRPPRRPPGAAARAIYCAIVYQAIAYQQFLDHIETTERPTTTGDPANAVRSAARDDRRGGIAADIPSED
jgi:hypothetical protein